jgi:hypothetical protein
MPYQDNDFTHDTDGQHLERCEILKAGIDTYGVELSFAPADITKIKTYCDDIKAAVLALAKESADVDEVYVELHDAETAARLKYVACQDYIRGEMQVATSGTAEWLNERFNIHGPAPVRREDFIKEANSMLDSYAHIAVEHPDVALNDVLFDACEALIVALKTAQLAVPKEKAEKSESAVEKRVLMETTGMHILRWVYQRAISFWGDEGPHLLELGFLPKSMIWTPGQPVPGSANFPDKVSNMSAVKADPPLTGIKVSCDLLNGAATYNIYREKVPTGAPRPSRPAVAWMSEITDPAALDGDVLVGNDYYYWMCGVDETNIEGAFSDAMMKWIG